MTNWTLQEALRYKCNCPLCEPRTEDEEEEGRRVAAAEEKAQMWEERK